jgi:PRTRC genetic system protein C
MALEVKQTPRVFIYGSLKLPDIPGKSVEEVRAHYANSGQHPELATASVIGPEATSAGMQYTFTRAIGSKG